MTALLALFTLASYLFVYTPLKRVSPISTTIGAIPGAMPPLIGYAAASGHLNYEAGILFAILFLWQFPHFYAIAWMYREDYARAGIRMLPVVEPTVDSTSRRIVWFSMALIPMSLAPKFFDMAGQLLSVRRVRAGNHHAIRRIPGEFDPDPPAGPPRAAGQRALPSAPVWPHGAGQLVS